MMQDKMDHSTAHIYFTQAFPKINVTLKVGKKIDNLHTLQSRFCLVKNSFYDSILIAKTDINCKLIAHHPSIETTQASHHIQFHLYGDFNCSLSDNLIYKAYRQLLPLIDSKKDVCKLHIMVEKNIPAGGGLGGGSVNAALTLLILNELFSLHLSKENMLMYAKTLGSDVAFFIMIYTQNSAHIQPYFYIQQRVKQHDLQEILIAFEREKILYAKVLESFEQKREKERIDFLSANVLSTGEIIEPFYEKLPPFLIHRNAISCDTGAVYAAFSRMQKQRDVAIDLQQDSLTLLETHSMETLNDLYLPACSIYNLATIAKELSSRYGNVYFSGSGSSFFSVKY